MGVQINQAGGDDVTRYVPHVGPRIGPERVSDHGHLAAAKGDIRDGVELLGRVDHPAAGSTKSKGIRQSPNAEGGRGGGGVAQ